MSAVAVFLENPKTLHNLGSAVRGCAAYGVPELRWTGERIGRKLNSTKQARLPRELRMKDYSTIVNFCHNNKPFSEFRDGVPVAVEFTDKTESLVYFEHPAQAIYVFGPEDGSISRVFRMHCQRFVTIPSNFCLNLADAHFGKGKRVHNGLGSKRRDANTKPSYRCTVCSTIRDV